jgi:hypothetical protein
MQIYNNLIFFDMTYDMTVDWQEPFRQFDGRHITPANTIEV